MTANYYGIFDTGYAKVALSTGTKFTRINSGSEVLIYGQGLNANLGLNSDSEVTPTKTTSNEFDLSKVSPVSTNNPKIVLRGVYKRSDTTQINNLKYVTDMIKTKGVKVFYYGSTGYNTYPSIFGTADVYHSSTGSYTSGTTKHLHVYVKSVTINEDNGNVNGLIKCTISLEETND